jgi:hypothetical protein
MRHRGAEAGAVAKDADGSLYLAFAHSNARRAIG